MIQITPIQYDSLLGFKLHIWSHYHDESKIDFSFWAEKLDGLKIPWFVQNTVAILMESRPNGFSSLRNLLACKGIVVE